MTEALGRICQVLLNGPLSMADMATAEALLQRRLQETAALADVGLPDLCTVWSVSDKPVSIYDTSALLALAPCYLLEGIWLARVSQPATAHKPLQCLLMRIYTELVGLDNPNLSPPSLYRNRIAQQGIDIPSIDNPFFFYTSGFHEAALEFSLLHLVLLHRPTRYLPELLGYTLAHVYRDPQNNVACGQEGMWLKHRDWARKALDFSLENDPGRTRINAGWHCYISASRRLNTALTQEAESNERRMLELLRARIPNAIGYHQNIKLNGRCLDEWFTEHQLSPEPVLRALRESFWVDSAKPANSRFLRAMKFGGPMFGVFNDEERALARAWVTHPDASCPFISGTRTTRSTLADDDCRTAPGTPKTERSPFSPSKRDRYLALLTAENPLDVPADAKAGLDRVLSRTKWLNRLGFGPRGFTYSAEALRRFTATRHESEVSRFKPLRGKPNADKAFCLWVMLQLTPAILVDGAWLSGIPNAAGKLSAADRELLKIHVDELGAGYVGQNHPNILRKLLESQSLHLPEFDSVDFAHYAGFTGAAFDIPNALLTIGRLAESYRPEVLGLNLAIELGGLGASYMRAIEILRYYHMDPTLIQLHLSIDNLASGHAARARNAIELYLEDIRHLAGDVAVQTQWQRIWSGYLALDVISLGLATQILSRYALHRAGWRVRIPGLTH